MTDASRRIVLGALALGLAAMFAVSMAWRMGDHPLVRQNTQAAAEHDHSAKPSRPVMEQGAETPQGMAIMGLMQKMKEDPHDPDTLLELARLFAEQGDIEGAKGMVQRAVVAAPSDHRAPYIMAVLLGKQEKWQDAAEQLERSIALRDDPASRYSAAVIYRYHLKQEDKARAMFEAAAKICQDASLAKLIREELAK